MKIENKVKMMKAGLEKTYDLFANPGGGEEGPCYITFCTVNREVNTVEKAHVLIEVAADENRRGILIMSVTERDGEDCYESVLSAAKEYEGATITESLSRWHGNYKVWMVSIPLH